MHRLAICLLLEISVFAQHYETAQHPSSFAMDFNEDIYNRELRVPPTDRLIFNFEQRRIDQPPQFEVRDENLRQYVGRPKTTTAVPVSTRYPEPPAQVPQVDTNHLYRLPEVRKPVSTASPKPYDPKQWGLIASHLPATLPPAPAMPKWMDLSDESFKYQAPSKYRSESYEPSVTAQLDKMDNQQQYPAYQQTHQIEVAQPSAEMYPDHVMESQKSMSAEEFVRPTGRGNHKFSWSDVSAPESVIPTTTVAAVAMKSHNPPPSFPTLSPWYDGFGK